MDAPGSGQIVLDDSEDAFINPNEVEEVQVNDDDVPMDEDNDGDEQMGIEAKDRDSQTTSAQVPDMSLKTISSHASSSVFAVATYSQSNTLTILSGGGDDKAFLHMISESQPETNTILLEHRRTDSVSCVATNQSLVSGDLVKTPMYLAVGCYDGSVVLYSSTGEKTLVLDGPTDVEFMSFHPKGGSVLLAGSISDATIWMYHLPSKKCLQVFVGHECNGEGGGVTDGCFTPDGKFAVSIGMDGTMRVWAPKTGVCRHVFKFEEGGGNGEVNGAGIGLTCLSVNGGLDGQLAIAGCESGSAYVVHLKGKKLVANLRHFDGPSAPSAGMNVDGSEDEQTMLPSVEAVGFASKISNLNWAATGGSDGKMKIWDLTHDGGQCRQVCKLDASNSSNPGESGGVTRLLWHPTLPLVFVSYSDGFVRLWDARDGKLLHTLTGGSNDNQINDMSIQFVNVEQEGGAALVATGNDDGTVQVYRVEVSTVLRSAMVNR